MSNTSKARLRIIGDVHGRLDNYLRLANQAEYSLQLGDLGFDYEPVARHLDASRHRVIGGNHDNYTKADGKFTAQPPHFFDDFGVWAVPGVEPIFYVRGAWSIDQKWRVEGKSWWPDEELTVARGFEAVELYRAIQPKWVVTHCCPGSVVPAVPFERLFGDGIIKTRTDALLEGMYDHHQPELWIFGHFHVDWDEVMVHPRTGKKTRFICLDELSYRDFTEAVPHEEDVIQRNHAKQV